MVLREEALIERAKTVLGIEPCAGQQEIKYAYYRRMFQHHPDRNPNPKAHEMAALIAEAYQVVMGKNKKPLFLQQDDLIELMLNRPVEAMEGLLSYEEWLKKQFYNEEDKSIWAC